MRYKYPILILALFCHSWAIKADEPKYSAELLYHKVSETVDWAYINNLNSTNQRIAYQTTQFSFYPGIRLGVEYHNDLTFKGHYTGYGAKSHAFAQGKLVSAFMGGKFAQGSTFFSSGKMNAHIAMHIIDLELEKPILLEKNIIISPSIGLRVASIHQSIHTEFSGNNPISEKVKNNFEGMGPTIGIHYKHLLYHIHNIQWHLLGNFSAAYLQGSWKLNDRTYNQSGSLIFNTKGKHHMGSFGINSLLGIQIERDHLSLRVGYEMQDWFDQYQVFDDGTGGQSKNLILQGCKIRLAYQF